jgi:hypothetical protein
MGKGRFSLAWRSIMQGMERFEFLTCSIQGILCIHEGLVLLFGIRPDIIHVLL